MRQIRMLLAVAAAALAGMGTASAAPPVVVGGGTGIVLGPAICSMTTVGYDGAGRLVGLTAGHCGTAGTAVFAERAQAAAPIGTIAFSDPPPGLDYAVIQLDPTRVSPVRAVGGTVINGVSPTPGFGGVVCENGRSTGRDCGIIWGDLGSVTVNQTCSRPGDSGGPVTMGDRLVGMNNGRIIGYGPLRFDVPCILGANPVHSPAYMHPIDNIIAAMNRRGGIGAGFRTY